MKIRLTELVRGMGGAHMTSLNGLLVLIAAAGVFAFLSIADEVSENEIAAIDTYVLLLFRDAADPSQPIGPPWLKETIVEITALGGYPILVLLVSIVIGFLLTSKRVGPAIFILLSIGSGTVMGHLLKIVYDRPRPDVVDHLVTTHTASFPSGHATMSAVVYLTLAAMIMRLVKERVVRLYVLCVAILLTLAVGTSRVYLGVHWPSDVLAGWALGAAWASLAWLVVTLLRDRRSGEGSIHADDR